VQENEDKGQQVQDENASEIARLFLSVLSETTGGMDEEQAAAYLAEVLEGGVETDHLFERLIVDHEQQFLVTSSNHPDTAVREASLAPRDQWQENPAGELTYLASNALEVYLGEDGQPLELGEALNKLRILSDSTVLTARVALGLWNSRRDNKALSRNGSVPVLLDELLAWQGHEKLKRLAHPGTDSPKRYTDGYRAAQKQRVVQDMAALAACHVRGSAVVTVAGKQTLIEVDGPYLRYDLVSRRTRSGERILIGFLVAPGGWITTYEQSQNELFAQIDRQIFSLNPQNDRYALRIALYLTERWREQAKSGTFSTPITMSALLEASMIEVDKAHLTSEFAPKIEQALERLEALHIIGKHLCLNPVDKTRTRWGKDWLASKWEILPPTELLRAYQIKPGRKKRLPKS
jgi:hypothetical protein